MGLGGESEDEDSTSRKVSQLRPPGTLAKIPEKEDGPHKHVPREEEPAEAIAMTAEVVPKREVDTVNPERAPSPHRSRKKEKKGPSQTPDRAYVSTRNGPEP